MLQAIANTLTEGESVTFQIERTDQGLQVVLTPLLKGAPKNPTPEIEQARAALATPLILRGSAEELDGTLTERLQGYSEARSALASEYERLLATLRDATNRTASAADKTAKPKKAEPATAAPAAATTAPKADTSAEAAEAPKATESSQQKPESETPKAAPTGPGTEQATNPNDLFSFDN